MIYQFIPVARLTGDPVMKSTDGGRQYCTFGIAADSGRKTGGGERISNFFNVTVWGAAAESCVKNLHKGDAVSVNGAFCARQYESTSGGMKTSLDISDARIDYLPRPKQDGEAAPAKSAPPAKQRRQSKPAYQQPEYEDDQSEDEDELPF